MRQVYVEIIRVRDIVIIQRILVYDMISSDCPMFADNQTRSFADSACVVFNLISSLCRIVHVSFDLIAVFHVSTLFILKSFVIK